MYRQILLHPNDHIYQKIVWRFLTLTSWFWMKRIISPLQLKNHARGLLILTGSNSIEEAISLQRELTGIFESGDFTLHK
ncbi:hypothetical protein PR048_031375, partial [Dryococelus australis]